MPAPIIEFYRFSFRYASRKEFTLHDISLSIQPGEKILIAGASGSGKTTVGNALNGLIPHSFKGEHTGECRVDSLEISQANLHEISKKVGTVLQDTDGQFVGLSVGEDIAFALENDAVPQPQMKESVLEAAELVDMTGFLDQSPFEISGGQKQRVSLAGILVDNVDILLFDEPLANLDPATGRLAIELIDSLHQRTGNTVVIIEHRLEDVLHRPVDRIILMNKGSIVADKTPDELLASNLLAEYGIREPLYLTAMKLAGIPIQAEQHPSSLTGMDISGYAGILKNWLSSRPAPPAQQASAELLRISNAAFSYDGNRSILTDVSFAIGIGETLALLGENGAGKSTLAKLLTGLIKPDSGSILWEGQNITAENIAQRSQRIGFVMQNPNHMISKHLIREEVGFGLQLRGVEEQEIETRTEETLKICGLYPFRNWPVSALSYGQKKRVTIASILILQPRLLIMDEPTAGQDYRHYTEFMEFVSELSKNMGLSVLLVTHDLHLALEYADRTLVLSEGTFIADGPVSEIFACPDLLNQANLKVTSLFELARKAGIPDANQFIAHFIEEERKIRRSQCG